MKYIKRCALSEKTELTLSVLLLLGAIGFGLQILWPLMQSGYATGGDDVIHMAYNHEAAEIMASKHKLFGWSYLFGFGAPIFLFRPPLQYLCVGFIHNVSAGYFSLVDIHKFFYVFFLAMYPAGVYYMMRKFRFKPLSCGIGALFAITPISMWGHTLHAYFWLGIMKQLMAIFIFPFALGKIHGCVSAGEKALPAALLIALSFLSHPYIPFCLFLICAVYWLVVLLGTGWRNATLAGIRFAVIWSLVVLLLAFYLAPFYTSPEIQQHEFSASWRHNFEVVCETTAMTLNHFFKGGLFDTTKWSVFGGGEWGWQASAYKNRIPMLSAMCFLGILVCIWRRRRFSHAVFLLASTLTLLVFLGPDDVPLMNYIPFMDQFQNIHVVFMLDLFAVSLAGIGAGVLVQGIAEHTVGTLLVSLQRRGRQE